MRMSYCASKFNSELYNMAIGHSNNGIQHKMKESFECRKTFFFVRISPSNITYMCDILKCCHYGRRKANIAWSLSNSKKYSLILIWRSWILNLYMFVEWIRRLIFAKKSKQFIILRNRINWVFIEKIIQFKLRHIKYCRSKLTINCSRDHHHLRRRDNLNRSVSLSWRWSWPVFSCSLLWRFLTWVFFS